MSEPTKTDITELLGRVRAGDDSALDRLIPIVYEELRRAARLQRRGWDRADTLNTTALVHEAFVRLAGQRAPDWKDRAHFMAVAAIAMRQILVDHARSHATTKRGANAPAVSLDRVASSIANGFDADHADAIVALDAALDRLAQHSDRQRRIVECRFFAGLSIAETAEALGISTATVNRGWAMAQAWLFRDLQSEPDG